MTSTGWQYEPDIHLHLFTPMLSDPEHVRSIAGTLMLLSEAKRDSADPLTRTTGLFMGELSRTLADLAGRLDLEYDYIAKTLAAKLDDPGVGGPS